MKKFPLLMVFVMIASCTDHQQMDNASLEDVEIRETLNEMAQTLASDPSWIDQTLIEKLKKGAVKSADLPSSIKLSKSNGFVQDIEIEMYDNSNVKSLSKSLGTTPYYVGLDPDVYNFSPSIQEELTGLPVMDMPVFYFDGQSVSETTVQLDPDKQTDKLIFFIKSTSLEPHTLSKSMQIAGTFFACRSIKVKVKQDESDEEFEVYFSNGSHPINSYFNGTTDHVFNGNTREDAAGNSRYYMDVNDKNLWYPTSDGQEISLIRVDNLTDSVRMVAIEADWSSGNYVQGRYNRNQQVGTTSEILTDYYDMTDNTKKLQENSAYYVDLKTSLNDDRYQKGVIKSINARTLYARTNNGEHYIETANADGGALTDVDWIIKQIVQ